MAGRKFHKSTICHTREIAWSSVRLLSRAEIQRFKGPLMSSNVIQFVSRDRLRNRTPPNSSNLWIATKRDWPPFEKQIVEMMIAISPSEGMRAGQRRGRYIVKIRKRREKKTGQLPEPGRATLPENIRWVNSKSTPKASRSDGRRRGSSAVAVFQEPRSNAGFSRP